jgi:hypothetical protein
VGRRRPTYVFIPPDTHRFNRLLLLLQRPYTRHSNGGSCHQMWPSQFTEEQPTTVPLLATGQRPDSTGSRPGCPYRWEDPSGEARQPDSHSHNHTFASKPPCSRRCPRVHAVGVSPSPYAPAAIVFSGRVHAPVNSRRIPRPPRNGRCLVPARSAPGCCGLGECRCVSLFWTRPRTCHRPCTRGSAAKRGSPRAMHGQPSGPKNRDRKAEGVSNIGLLSATCRQLDSNEPVRPLHFSHPMLRPLISAPQRRVTAARKQSYVAVPKNRLGK